MNTPHPPFPAGIEPANGPFAAMAAAYQAAGLMPIPCNGKRPLIPYRTLTEPHSPLTLSCLGVEHHSANLGILTGRGRCAVTMVDVDDPAFVEAAAILFGPSPIMVGTPSGGVHLWYRHSGEACANLRAQGLPIDIKGAGGFVVAPPSVGPAGKGSVASQPYRFLRGSLALLSDLVPIAAAGVALLEARGRTQATLPANRAAGTRRLGGPVPEGQRNNLLFSWALHLALGSSSLAALKSDLDHFNRESCKPPLPDREVAHVARSAWSYQQRDENWCRGQGVARVTEAERAALPSPDALALLLRLRTAHGARREPFAVAVRAMAGQQCIEGMGEHKLRRARCELLDAGFLVCVHQGGRGKRDPSLFYLRAPAPGG